MSAKRLTLKSALKQVTKLTTRTLILNDTASKSIAISSNTSRL